MKRQIARATIGAPTLVPGVLDHTIRLIRAVFRTTGGQAVEAAARPKPTAPSPADLS
jgi:hypothetical protein